MVYLRLAWQRVTYAVNSVLPVVWPRFELVRIKRDDFKNEWQPTKSGICTAQEGNVPFQCHY